MYHLGPYSKVKRVTLQMMEDRGFPISPEEQPLLTASEEQLRDHYVTKFRRLHELGLAEAKPENMFTPAIMTRLYVRTLPNGRRSATLVYFDDSIGDSFVKGDFARFERVVRQYRDGPPTGRPYDPIINALHETEPGILYNKTAEGGLLPIHYGQDLENVILVLRVKPTTTAAGTREQLASTFTDVRVEPFMLEELYVSPQRHFFAPVFQKLTDQEKQEHMVGKRVAQIPIIQRTRYGATGVMDDPQAKYAGWQNGDLIRVTRTIYQAPTIIREQVSYRHVSTV